LDVNQPRQLQAIAQQIRQTIQTAAVPAPWLDELEAAVKSLNASSLILRPSFSLPTSLDPTLSYRTTGLFRGKVCWSDRSALAHSLKQVWSELFRAQSLVYWQRLGVELQHIHLAVLVQPLQQAVASGLLQDHNQQLEVRAIWGQGQGLTEGQVMPDCYRVDLQGHLLTETLGLKTHAYRIHPGTAQPLQLEELSPAQQSQPVLTPPQLEQLTSLIKQAALELGVPLNTEWIQVQSSESTLEFWLTQVTPQLKIAKSAPAPTVSASPTAIETKLQGTGAAPGYAKAPAWVMSNPDSSADMPPSGVILVTSYVTPQELNHLKQVVAVVTEQGGKTSHAAILARELGIPAVVGVSQATDRIHTGEMLWVDGDRGQIWKKQPSGPELVTSSLKTAMEPPPVSPFPTHATQLWVTLSQTDSLQQALQLPIDGVGLLRSELMLLQALEEQPLQIWLEQGKQTELIERLAVQIEQVAAALAPRPVFYRSADFSPPDFPSLTDPSRTNHLALGMRGVSRYPIDSTLFAIELAALRQVQQQGYPYVHLILPFVRTVEEFTFCRQQVEQAGLRQVSTFQLWIMAEVPSVLLLLPDYIQAGVEGIAIGSNDLTQLLLGVDRNHPHLSHWFDPPHPVVLQAIGQLVQTARQANIPCSLCGQLSPTPALIDPLIRWGITAISVTASQIEPLARAIAQAEQRLLVEAARQHLRL
jgi:pyruvate,water dikinase